MTLRGRLTVATTAVVLALTLVLGLALYVLIARAQTHDALVGLREIARQEARGLARTGRLAERTGTAVALLAPGGGVLLGRWPTPLPAPHSSRSLLFWRLPNDAHALALRLPGGDYLAVARGDPQAVRELGRIRRYLLLLGLAAGAAAALLSWLIAGRMLRPLRRVAQTAADIARHGDVSRRLGQLGEGEMRDLSEAFDAMLDRLAHALEHQRQAGERERQFASDAAHVLRNPLATVILNLEFLERQLPTGSEEHAAAADAGAEARRLLGLGESLLRLARGGSVGSDAPAVDLSAVAGEAARVVAEARGRAAPEIEVSPTALVRGDRAALFGLVESIVDNAYKYSPEDAPVAVRVTAGRGLVRIVVEDRGQGIAAEDLPHVFDRFYRGGSRTEGHGLGLAIAQAVAVAHGGQISVESRVGEGTRVTVEIPAAQ